MWILAIMIAILLFGVIRGARQYKATHEQVAQLRHEIAVNSIR